MYQIHKIINYFYRVLFFTTLLTASQAQAGPVSGYPHCFLIDSIPYTITAPGVYCFAHKKVSAFGSGALVTIKSDDVVLDLNGTILDGSNSQNGINSVGVRSNGHKNVVVRNGTVRNFGTGISLTHFHSGTTEDSQMNHGLVIESVHAYRNKMTGIRIEGNGSIARNNIVQGTGGARDVNGFSTSFGIYASGRGIKVVNNDVSDTLRNKKSGQAYAIYIASISQMVSALVIHNRINDSQFGIFGSVANWGSYRDNITLNVNVSYTGGTDLGNNH